MNPVVILVGIDVDDVRHHGCALDQRTAEPVQFQHSGQSMPSLKLLDDPDKTHGCDRRVDRDLQRLVVDVSTGLCTAIAILMAVVERNRSGHGQSIDTTLCDCAVSPMHPHVRDWSLSGKVPTMTGDAHPDISPCDEFRQREAAAGVDLTAAARSACGRDRRPAILPALDGRRPCTASAAIQG